MNSSSKREPPRSLWRTLVIAAVATGTAIGIGSLAAAYLSTHPIRRRVRRFHGWLESEAVAFSSSDGIVLRGSFLRAEDAKATIILCHGFPNNRSELGPWVETLRDRGFHLLLFDFRAMGESGGSLSTIGAAEVLDLIGAVNYLELRENTRGLPIGVFGLSMGGAVAIMAAARDERISAVAAHAAYATLEGAIDRRFRLFMGPFGRIGSGLATWWGSRWLPSHPREVSPLAAIGAIAPRSVLLFHGGRDLLTHPSDSERLYDAAAPPKILHRLPRSWHTSVHSKEWEEYCRVLVEFFEGTLRH